jgi:all-trans-retinol dehydrogenase (NAD+)
MNIFVDKVVLVTGGSSGIGRLMALDFANRGAKVAVWDLRPDALAALEAEARSRGLFIKGYLCDVADREAVYRQAEVLKAELGPVDVLVNNAGVVSGSTFLKTPDEKMEKAMQVNVIAHFWTCKAFLPSMIERNTGHLVTISSAAGLIGLTGLVDYSASKFAAFGFHEAIRMELSRFKSAVKTTIVCPYFINTGMFDGVKTRFPLLLPILKSEYATRRIVKAVQKNRQRLIMPRLVYAVLFIRILPPVVFDFIANFMGINHSMDAFKGRNTSGAL